MNTELINEVEQTPSLLVITKTLIGQADDLAEEHEQFNTNYIVAGRLALYELLAKIFALYKQLEVAPDKSELVASMRHTLAKQFKIRTQVNSSALGMLVRYITRAERKTTHVYARAIETAITNNIQLEDFVDYIQAQGGIEHLRSIGANSPLTLEKEEFEKEKWELSWKYCQAREEFPIANFDLKNDVDYGRNKKVTFEYFVCANRKGKRYVLAKIPADEAFEDRAIKLLGDFIGDDIENSREHINKLFEKARDAHKKRIAIESPALAKILANMEQKSSRSAK